METKQTIDRFKVSWIQRGGRPTEKANPAYPNGVDVDLTCGVDLFCTLNLPYPPEHPNIGMYVVECMLCGTTVTCTTAGRTDDPRSLKIACKGMLKT